MNSLKLCYWNANGLSQHKLELREFLQNNQIDVMLISETHLTHFNNFSMQGYTFYDTKHPDGKAHGGTGILVKNRIKHHVMEEYCKEYLHSTTICIQENGGAINVSAVYCPPRFNITETQFEEFFATLGSKFLAAGDYNAKHSFWGSRLISPKGRRLWSAITQANLDVISTGQPTYWPTDPRKIPDLIDFGITKNIRRHQISVESSFDLSSDHSPSIITLEITPSTFFTPKHLTNQHTNWLKYRKYISSHINLNIPLKSEQNINSAVLNFTQILQQAAIIATPAINTKAHTATASTQIMALVNKKRRLRREWQTHRSPNLKKQLAECTQNLRKLLQDYAENDLQQFLQNLGATKATDYSLWKATRKLKNPISIDAPIRLSNGKWARSESEKGEEFAKHLQSVFTPNPEVCHVELSPTLHTPNVNITRIKPRDLYDAIASINVRKAPGIDKINGKMIKELPNIAKKLLLYIMNGCLNTKYFPKDWKLSQITMVPKPGKDATLVTSYRPISLLPLLSKLFEKLIIKQLWPILNSKHVIPTHQFGFREKHSTLEQVHRITSEIRKAFEEKKYCSAIFLDVAQAFDKVWHEGLLYKIKEIFPENIYKLLNSYLSNRMFSVRQKSFNSRNYPICAGVPQGSVLGPILYLIYTCDLPTHTQLLTSTFADDTAILSTHSDPRQATINLQNHLKAVEKWLAKWRIKVNETKSSHITFTLRRETCSTVTLNNNPIPQKVEVNYLGMNLDRRLTWRKHIEAKRTQCNIKSSKLQWLLSSNAKLSLENKILIYKSIIKPIWTYGIQLWGTASPSNIEKLQRMQSKMLRYITGAPWFIRNSNLHKDLKIPTVEEEVQQFCSKYTLKLRTHPNTLARNLLQRQYQKRLKSKDTIDLEIC